MVRSTCLQWGHPTPHLPQRVGKERDPWREAECVQPSSWSERRPTSAQVSRSSRALQKGQELAIRSLFVPLLSPLQPLYIPIPGKTRARGATSKPRGQEKVPRSVPQIDDQGPRVVKNDRHSSDKQGGRLTTSFPASVCVDWHGLGSAKPQDTCCPFSFFTFLLLFFFC